VRVVDASAYFVVAPVPTVDRVYFNVGKYGGVVINHATPNHMSGSLGADDGTTAKFAALRGAQKAHGSVQDIGKFFDWDQQSQPRFIHLLGHGNSGLFDVGCGQHSITTTGTLLSGFLPYWEPELQRTAGWDPDRNQRTPVSDVDYSGGLVLEGCCVAFGDRGTRLMKEVADATLRDVFAYTGLIYVSDHVAHERGHSWMRRPPLANKPVVERHYGVSESTLAIRTKLEELIPSDWLDPTDVVAIHIEYVQEGLTIKIDGARCHAIIEQIFHNPGFRQEGSFPAVLTHRISIKQSSSQDISLDILAERLIRSSIGLFYIAGPEFADLVSELKSKLQT
jgi:hypothetical protein